jgi:GlpG protein
MGRGKRIQSGVRSIGHLPNEAQARRFGDYLLARGIRNEVEAEADGPWLIWVLDDEQLEEGRARLEAFRREPDAAEFSQARSKAEQVRAQEEKEQSAWRRRVHNRRHIFPGSKAYGAGPLTYVLIVACVVVTILLQTNENEAVLLRCFITIPGSEGFLPEVCRGEVWRLFTPVLLHFGAMHLLFNMMWLFSLGSLIESVHGSGRFGLLVVILAVGSNLAEHVLGHHATFGGMSGVNYGLLGYVWIRGKCDPGSGLHLDKQTVLMAIIWFFLCLTGLAGAVANWAHGAGLALGMAWGWITAKLALRNL